MRKNNSDKEGGQPAAICTGAKGYIMHMRSRKNYTHARAQCSDATKHIATKLLPLAL